MTAKYAAIYQGDNNEYQRTFLFWKLFDIIHHKESKVTRGCRFVIMINRYTIFFFFNDLRYLWITKQFYWIFYQKVYRTYKCKFAFYLFQYLLVLYIWVFFGGAAKFYLASISIFYMEIFFFFIFNSLFQLSSWRKLRWNLTVLPAYAGLSASLRCLLVVPSKNSSNKAFEG